LEFHIAQYRIMRPDVNKELKSIGSNLKEYILFKLTPAKAIKNAEEKLS